MHSLPLQWRKISPQVLSFIPHSWKPVYCDTVRRETQRDLVVDIVLQGTYDFPQENKFKPYRNRSKELTAHHYCLLWEMGSLSHH